MSGDVEQELQAHAERPPAAGAGGHCGDTLVGAVLHLLLSLYSPCRARRPRRVAKWMEAARSSGQYILDGKIMVRRGSGDFMRWDRTRPVSGLDLT